MNEITYQNKVALNEKPEIADINKVTDDDMNEIKSVVNTNSRTSSNNFGLGTDTWTSSATYSIGDIVVYNDNTYKNLTGTNTTTTPDQDNTNWEVMPLILNVYNTSTKNAYSSDYINNTFGGEIVDGTPYKTGKTYNGKDVYRLIKNLGYLPSGVLSDATIPIGITNFTLFTMPKIMYAGILGGKMRYFPNPFIGSSNINTWIGEDGNAYVTTGTDRSSLQITVDLEFIYNS
jgi:hypothetical protein